MKSQHNISSSMFIKESHSVMEILSHVNKRVKHQQQIGLPLEELWHLYIENNAALMVINFCIVYVEMAFDLVIKEVCIYIFVV
ncbi:putative proteasome component Ecm29 [Helianthus annuus]|nr:putative proteasome component Ecm29 [Helianthus annuus]